MTQKLNRRTVLGSIAALGISGNAVARAKAQSSSESDSATEFDAERTAVEWTNQAVWESSGCATEIPLQVMYPGDTLFTFNALDELGAGHRVDVETAATNAARLQVPGTGKYTLTAGGFDSFAGDFLGPWVRATYGGIVLADRMNVSFNRTAAVDFIERMQFPDGGFGPRLSFFGNRPLPPTMESTAQALKTLQRLDALSPEVRGEALSFLMEQRTTDGGWPRGGTRTDPTVSGTYYALRGLDAIDRLPPGLGKRAASFLRSRQADGGGFYQWQEQSGIFSSDAGDTSSSDPSTTADRKKVTNTPVTAKAILGLARADQLGTLDSENLEQHARWLANRQETDTADPRFRGGFETRGDTDMPIIDYRTNTRLALRALQTLQDHGINHQANIAAGVDLLVRCQHEHTGGIGAWPSYVTHNRSTAAAMRSLNRLGARKPADALADTFMRLQRSNGSIPPLDWEYRSQTDQTAHALLALSNVQRLDAVDVGAASRFMADQQSSGGFAKYTNPDSDPPPSLRVTNVVVPALTAAGELGRIDVDAAGEYYARTQLSNGAISTVSPGPDHVADTSSALQALADLGELNTIDLDAATTYLVDLSAEDGEYWPDPSQAGWAVLGLSAADALDRIDTDATRTYLENNQYGTGGYAARVFYLSYTSLQRHAAAVAGLSLLGGHPDDGATVAIQEHRSREAIDMDDIAGVAWRPPGQGWLNGREQLVAVDELPENQ